MCLLFSGLGAHRASGTVDGFSLFVVMASCWTTFSNILGGKTVSKLIKNNISKRLQKFRNFLPSSLVISWMLLSEDDVLGGCGCHYGHLHSKVL